MKSTAQLPGATTLRRFSLPTVWPQDQLYFYNLKGGAAAASRLFSSSLPCKPREVRLASQLNIQLKMRRRGGSIQGHDPSN